MTRRALLPRDDCREVPGQRGLQAGPFRKHQFPELIDPLLVQHEFHPGHIAVLAVAMAVEDAHDRGDGREQPFAWGEFLKTLRDARRGPKAAPDIDLEASFLLAVRQAEDGAPPDVVDRGET